MKIPLEILMNNSKADKKDTSKQLQTLRKWKGTIELWFEENLKKLQFDIENNTNYISSRKDSNTQENIH
jgi:hypothetical protein